MGARTAILTAALAAVATVALVPNAGATRASSSVCRKATSSGRAVPSVALGVSGAYSYKGGTYSASGERLRFWGKLEGAPVNADPVTIRVYVSGKLARTATFRLTDYGCDAAAFSYRTNIWKTGHIAWKIEHPASTGADAFSKSAGGPFVYQPAAGFGDRGTGVAILLAMLRSKAYYAPYGSIYGAGTGKAVLAFRKVNRMTRIETPSRQIYHLLQTGRGGIHAHYPRLGEHLEADLSRQVMTFYKGSKALEIHPISSGKPSTPTILGKYRFYMREIGTNGHGMVDSVYFHNGYATHGYAELPTYAASHGCLRTWVPSARHIYNRIKLGEWIAVFW
jgi:hypothetical protein